MMTRKSGTIITMSDIPYLIVNVGMLTQATSVTRRMHRTRVDASLVARPNVEMMVVTELVNI